MICVKISKTVRSFAKKGEVIRVSNETAHRLVREGKATYTDKTTWKAEGRKYR